MQIRYVATAAAAWALVAPALALDFSYSGFSTAAYSQTDTDEAEVGSLMQPNGIDGAGTFAIDSKLGLQVTAKFTEAVSATVQGLAYSDLTGEWTPHLDWAYVRWQALPSLSGRAGYLRAPTYLFSDSIFVGYANMWVRGPQEVYKQAPAYQLRGVDLTWRQGFGPLTLSLQPFFGDSQLVVGLQEDEYDLKNWGGLVVTAEFNALTVRGSYSTVEMDSNMPALVPVMAGLRALPASVCSGCAVAADGLSFKGTKYKILAFGANYDDGTNQVIFEYTKRTDSAVITSPDLRGAYATYGRRFGGLTPYATFAIVRLDSATTSNLTAGAPAPYAAVVKASLNTNSDQDTYSVGLRYELPSFAVVNGALLKLQYDHIEAEGRGMLNDVKPGFDGELDMITLSFDFIF